MSSSTSLQAKSAVPLAGFDAGRFEATLGHLARPKRICIEKAPRTDSAPLATVERVSSTGSFRWWPATHDMIGSEELYRIFGFKPAQSLTEAHLSERVHPQDARAFQQMLLQARRGAALDHHCRLLMPDGAVRYIHLVASRTAGPRPKVEYFGVVQDVTQQRAAEMALEQMRSELTRLTRIAILGTLTASITHEISQPLTGIITNASACLRTLGTDTSNIDGAREMLRRAMRDGHRAAEVFSRLRSLFAKKNVAIEPVDLNEAVREVIPLVTHELRRRGSVLQLQLHESLPAVAADRVQLQQVIINLLSNASEAMLRIEDRPRHLVLKTEPDASGRPQLSVTDVGSGFGPQEFERLFDPFYTTKSDGMGIGLSVSRSIIESHGGRLWARSNRGPGATFLFCLPLADA